MFTVGMKVIVEFIPNHTGDDHVWFTTGVNEDNARYVWNCDATVGTTPKNNWVRHLATSEADQNHSVRSVAQMKYVNVSHLLLQGDDV